MVKQRGIVLRGVLTQRPDLYRVLTCQWTHGHAPLPKFAGGGCGRIYRGVQMRKSSASSYAYSPLQNVLERQLRAPCLTAETMTGCACTLLQVYGALQSRKKGRRLITYFDSWRMGRPVQKS
ncbi:hypothetical protein D5R40_28640 [Okeania hirsuta]|uniref:Uncharacterized protein n=1 Tax=Okeania hirsuta TaxID=1458930 RepID=A0A3N6P2B4_9CYAN|nr:hypothetical protein D5R40_28640 [Okeania hirsuta]